MYTIIELFPSVYRAHKKGTFCFRKAPCMYGSGTPGGTALEVRKCPYFHWKAEFKGFPMVCNTPILLNIGMSYTVGKLLTSAFQCIEVRKRVSAYLLPASLTIENWQSYGHPKFKKKTVQKCYPRIFQWFHACL